MNKKVKIAVFAGAGVLILGTGIGFGAKKLRKTVVDVYPVSELSQPIWGEMTSLEGSISTHVSQNVRLMDRQIVSKVHVQEGQEVKEGDPLLTYDMTLVNLDLEMEKLNKQKLEIKKKGLEQDLKNLKKGKFASVSGTEDYKLEALGTANREWKKVETAESELPQGIGQGVKTLTDPTDPSEPIDPTDPTDPSEPTDPTDPTDPSEPTDPTDPTDPSEPTDPTDPTDPSEPTDPTDPTDPSEPTDPTDPSGPTEPQSSPAYMRLYWDVSLETSLPDDGTVIEQAVPFAGLGSKEDPLRFLCKKGVLIQGAFLNHIAGFDANGERVNPGLYCQLEVRSEDSESGLLLAAMQLDGNALEKPVQADAWFSTKLGKNEWEELPPDGGNKLPGGVGGIISGGSIIGGYSKEELKKAIADKEREIITAGLDIRETDIKIKKVQQKLEDETIRSTVNGIVKKVGDPAKGEVDDEPFIVVESTGGVYVQGRVSEDLLEKVKAGQMLTGVAYESGMPFEAEVKEVSQFPVNNYYMGGPRELSYYPFTAFIQNAEGLKDNEMVTMDMPQTDGGISGIFISKEYVRTKDGEDFVYKEGKNKKLEKQVVKTGKVFYGYLVEIKEGITQEDYLAFPYGKKVKNGAKVKQSSLSELYNMY